MNEKKPRVGKNGGAKRVAGELSKIRNAPVSPKVFDILEQSEKNKNQNKKSARPPVDLES